MAYLQRRPGLLVDRRASGQFADTVRGGAHSAAHQARRFAVHPRAGRFRIAAGSGGADAQASRARLAPLPAPELQIINRIGDEALAVMLGTLVI